MDYIDYMCSMYKVSKINQCIEVSTIHKVDESTWNHVLKNHKF